MAGVVALYVHEISADLPDYQVLANYEPKVTTRLHAADGSLMAEYAKRAPALPAHPGHPAAVEAGLSRPPRTRTSTSIPASTCRGWRAPCHGRAPRATASQGASTITQQVAKNFLLTRRAVIERKIKEAILSLRIERAYSKDRILELYLNEIYLGLGSYGVAAASLAYFDKSVNELEIQEAAYLAALPKAPEQLQPVPQSRPRHGAPQLGHRPDGRERLHHARRGERGARPSRSASSPSPPAPISSPPSTSPRRCAAR